MQVLGLGYRSVFPSCSWVVGWRVVWISTGNVFRSKSMVWVPMDRSQVSTRLQNQETFGLGLPATMGNQQRSTAQYTSASLFVLSSMVHHQQRVHFPAIQVLYRYVKTASTLASVSTLNSVTCLRGPRPEHFYQLVVLYA